MTDDLKRIHRFELPRPRRIEDHKGRLGRVLVIGGSRGMSGAPWLAARSALRAGAGLATMAVPHSLFDGFQGRAVETMTIGIPELPEAEGGGLDPDTVPQLHDVVRQSYEVVVAGCGIGRSNGTGDFFHQLLREPPAALVIDADGLRHVAMRGLRWHSAERPVLTPHTGEMSSLADLSPEEVEADRLGTAVRVARDRGATVVLKGHRSVVTDGERYYINHTGTAALATAGSGDVLAGLIGALRGRGLGSFEAAQLGVHVHGLAGDLAVRRLGNEGVTAGALIDTLPAAIARTLA